MRFVLIVISLFIVFSCSQKPAPIAYKGENFFYKNSPVYIAKTLKLKTRNVAKIKRNLKPNQIKIKKGDNLYFIAKDYKISLRELIEYNNLKPPYVVYPDDIVEIPNNRETYIVARDDNLTMIAKKHNISFAELVKINNFDRKYKVRIGEVLILPYGSKKEIKRVRVAKKIQNKKIQFIWPIKGNIIKSLVQEKMVFIMMELILWQI